MSPNANDCAQDHIARTRSRLLMLVFGLAISDNFMKSLLSPSGDPARIQRSMESSPTDSTRGFLEERSQVPTARFQCQSLLSVACHLNDPESLNVRATSTLAQTSASALRSICQTRPCERSGTDDPRSFLIATVHQAHPSCRHDKSLAPTILSRAAVDSKF